jgi:hypothetical protein
MTYRVSYYDASAALGRNPEAARRVEHFNGEFEALRRARQLLEDGDCHGIAVHDDQGGILAGIRLQLKLGVQPVD